MGPVINRRRLPSPAKPRPGPNPDRCRAGLDLPVASLSDGGSPERGGPPPRAQVYTSFASDQKRAVPCGWGKVILMEARLQSPGSLTKCEHLSLILTSGLSGARECPLTG